MFLALAATCAFGTPINFTGIGWVSGNDTWYDLAGDNFNWHISGDTTAAAGRVCAVGMPCDLSIFVFADSLSDVTSVSGTFNGQTWGASPQHVFSSLNVIQQGVVGSGNELGSHLRVPVEVAGSIFGPDLELRFSGRGINESIFVMSRDGTDAGLIFSGWFKFKGAIEEVRTITDAPEPEEARTITDAPEPAAWLLSAGGIGLIAARALSARRKRSIRRA